MLQAMTFCLDETGRSSNVLGEFQTTVEEFDIAFPHTKQLVYIRDGLLGIELLAGEDVQAEVVLFRECMDANMTFSNKHKA